MIWPKISFGEICQKINVFSQSWNDPSKQKSNKCSKHAFVFTFAIFSLWEQLKNSNFKPTEGLYTLDIELMISNDGHLSIHVFACCCLLKNVIGFDIWQQNSVSGKNRQLVIIIYCERKYSLSKSLHVWVSLGKA